MQTQEKRCMNEKQTLTHTSKSCPLNIKLTQNRETYNLGMS